MFVLCSQRAHLISEIRNLSERDAFLDNLTSNCSWKYRNNSDSNRISNRKVVGYPFFHVHRQYSLSFRIILKRIKVHASRVLNWKEFALAVVDVSQVFGL